MGSRLRFAIGIAVAALAASLIPLDAQGPDAFLESRDHPAIGYSSSRPDNRIETLNRGLARGDLQFAFDAVSGYLPSTLDALGVSVESQTLVFSETSFQAPLINVANPRAVFFDDTAYVGWVRGGDILEVAVQDPRQGALFYELRQEADGLPQFRRNEECLACHLSWDTLAVPGLLMHSTAPLANERAYAFGFSTDHRSPFTQRWGGWFVTGDHGGTAHMGNVAVTPPDRDVLALSVPTAPLSSVRGLFDLAGYPGEHSDLAALMVLAHQTRMVNLITRTGWEARVFDDRAAPGKSPERVRDAARELVDYLLFVNETPIGRPVAGSSGFADYFSAQGPRSADGRSFYELDLEHRLLRYRCSYMVYTPAFDALPATALDAVYTRLWAVLSGKDASERYTSLTAAERQGIVEILRDTKDNLPDYFQSLTP
jgi:hypothetical protein